MRRKTKTVRATASRFGTRLDSLFLSLFLLGVGAYTPWGVLLSAVDYFEDLYPDRDVLRWISISCIPAMFIAVLANTFIHASDRGHSRIAVGFSLFIVLLLSIPAVRLSFVSSKNDSVAALQMDLVFIHSGNGTATTFWATMLNVVVLGILDGIVEGSFTGLALYLPDQYYQGYLSGNGFASVVMIVLRVATKAAFTDSASGLRISAYIFFLSSCLICIFCLLTHRYVVVPHPLFQASPLPDAGAPLIEDCIPEIESIPHTPLGHRGAVYRTLASRLKTTALLLFFFNVVVYTLFPGVISDVECDAMGSWYDVMLVAVFAVSDFGARLTPECLISTHQLTVTLAVLGVGALVPITLLAAHSFSNPFVISFLLSILGISNGYLSLCVYGMGQKVMQGAAESFIGGNILFVFVMTGMTMGSVCSMISSKLY